MIQKILILMRSKITLIVCLLSLYVVSIAQSSKITKGHFVSANNYQIISSKGFIFFSKNNIYYIDSLKDEEVIRAPFLTDIFIPAGRFKNKNSLFDNFLMAKFKQGIRLVPFKQRDILLSKSLLLTNDTLGNECYKEKTYNILPVLIRYKKFSNYPMYHYCGNTVILLTNNRLVKFQYSTPSIEVISVSPLKDLSN
jgi:hypothetical protein